MNSEFDALLCNQTWELVPPSHHLNAIGCRWIFKIKRKADGSIKRYKARLVAITDLGPLSFFLGIEAIRDTTGLFLTQCRYIADLLTKSKMDGVNPRINIGS
jgi:hypothetical protein